MIFKAEMLLKMRIMIRTALQCVCAESAYMFTLSL